jgi:hypothetical protein
MAAGFSSRARSRPSSLPVGVFAVGRVALEAKRFLERLLIFERLAPGGLGVLAVLGVHQLKPAGGAHLLGREAQVLGSRGG